MTRSILEQWALGPSEVVAAVGAGGKSTFIEALARAYEAEGRRVVLTATTKISPPAPDGRPLVLVDRLEGLHAALGGASYDSARPGAVGQASPELSPVVGRRLLPDGKVQGVPPEWVASLRDLPWAEAVLVEADGSAGRSLKAPEAWEPVVPSCTSLLVALAGLDAQGVPLDDAHVHRADRVAALLGLAPPNGDPSALAVSRGRAPGRAMEAGGSARDATPGAGYSPVAAAVPPEALLEVVSRGYGAVAPPAARFLVLLTKADLVAPSEGLAGAAAASPLEVWVSAAAAQGGLGLRCLRPRDGRPEALVLAAGSGTRMEGPKLLARLADVTVLGRVLRVVTAGDAFARVLLVCGNEVWAQRAALADEVPRGPWLSVLNPLPEEGMASSLRLGVETLGHDRDVAVFLGDQPFVTPDTAERLIEARAAHPRAAAVALAGEDGPVPPLIVHRSLLPQLLEQRGDQGARGLLRRYSARVHLVAARGGETFDLDTGEDLDQARAGLRPESSSGSRSARGE